MANSGNSAGRLYRILNEARQKPDTIQIKEVWAQVFRIQSDQVPELFDRLIRLRKLVDTAQEEIQTLPDIDHRLYLEPFPAIKSALSYTNLEAPWQIPKHHLRNDVMRAIELCSEILAVRGKNEKIVNEDELIRLQEEVEAVIKKVLENNFDEELKRFLIDKLEQIRRAILVYRIDGKQGFEEAIQDSLGAMYYFYHSKKSQSQTQWNKEEAEVLSRFWKIIERLSALIGLSTTIAQLIGPYIPPLLEAGPGH